jgi:hypothetical protein
LPTKALNYRELEAVHDHAVLADDVYKNTTPSPKAIEGGWKRVFTSDQIPGLGDGGFYGAFYIRKKEGRPEYAIAFRGMDSTRDLDDVFRIAVGKSPKQVKDAEQFTRIIADQLHLNPADINFCGHSLGGYLAKSVGMAVGAKNIYAYNSPGLFDEDIKRLSKNIETQFRENADDITLRRMEENVISVSSRMDIVSWVGPHKGRNIQIDTLSNHHQISTLRTIFAAEVANANTRLATPAPQPSLNSAPSLG